MLRESSNRTGNSFDLNAIVDHEAGSGGVPSGDLLIELVESVLLGEASDVAAARKKVLGALGGAALVDACATVASFNAVVKIADGSGIPLEEAKAARTKEIRQSLGIDDFRQ